MIVLLTILTIWVLLIFALSIIDLKWGVVAFLAYLFLVPVGNLQFDTVKIGENVVYTVFLVIYLYKTYRNQYKIDYKPFIPFLVYYICILLEMPFQNGVGTSTMLQLWRSNIQGILFLPFVMWNVIINDRSALVLFRNTILVCLAISLVYGLFLTTTGGINPYVTMFFPLMDSGVEYYSDYYAVESGRVFGRISSVFLHPMTFFLFLGLSLLYIAIIRKKISSTTKWLYIIPILFLMVVGGVRTILVAMFVTIFVYLLQNKKVKYAFYSLFFFVAAYNVLSFFPELFSYVSSVSDVNSKDVSGSSIALRLRQLQGSMDISSDNPLFGLGHGWTSEYLRNKGSHPVCLHFESLLFMIICNYGFCGFIMWGVFIYLYIDGNKKYVRSSRILLNSLMVLYVSFSCITGEYGYMKYFLLFYVLMLAEAEKKNLALLLRLKESKIDIREILCKKEKH